jgi:glycine cleavage system aminomethyltransferase T
VVVVSGQDGHVYDNIVDSVAQVTSGHVGVSLGQSVTISVVQGGHTVVGSVVNVKASVVPAGKTVF